MEEVKNRIPINLEELSLKEREENLAKRDKLQRTIAYYSKMVAHYTEEEKRLQLELTSLHQRLINITSGRAFPLSDEETKLIAKMTILGQKILALKTANKSHQIKEEKKLAREIKVLKQDFKDSLAIYKAHFDGKNSMLVTQFNYTRENIAKTKNECIRAKGRLEMYTDYLMRNKMSLENLMYKSI